MEINPFRAEGTCHAMGYWPADSRDLLILEAGVAAVLVVDAVAGAGHVVSGAVCTVVERWAGPREWTEAPSWDRNA